MKTIVYGNCSSPDVLHCEDVERPTITRRCERAPHSLGPDHGQTVTYPGPEVRFSEVLVRWIKRPDRGRMTEHGSCRSKNLIKTVALSS